MVTMQCAVSVYDGLHHIMVCETGTLIQSHDGCVCYGGNNHLDGVFGRIFSILAMERVQIRPSLNGLKHKYKVDLGPHREVRSTTNYKNAYQPSLFCHSVCLCSCVRTYIYIYIYIYKECTCLFLRNTYYMNSSAMQQGERIGLNWWWVGICITNYWLLHIGAIMMDR